MAPAPKSLRKKSVLPAQNWIARVNHGLAMRKEGEKIIAQALRERLNKVGEQEWLRECARPSGAGAGPPRTGT